MQVTTYQMPTMKQVKQSIQYGNYASSIDIKDSCFIPIVKHHCHLLHLFGTTVVISRRFCFLSGYGT